MLISLSAHTDRIYPPSALSPPSLMSAICLSNCRKPASYSIESNLGGAQQRHVSRRLVGYGGWVSYMLYLRMILVSLLGSAFGSLSMLLLLRMEAGLNKTKRGERKVIVRAESRSPFRLRKKSQIPCLALVACCQHSCEKYC